jgi:hypothetical protein
MISMRCESATCFCDSEVQFHAGTGSYCSEYCAVAEFERTASCECTHPGCETPDRDTAPKYAAVPSESTGSR